MRGFVPRLAAAGAALLLAACGGGGSSSPAGTKVPVATSSQAPTGASSATFSISLHPTLTTSGAQRKPRYVSPTMQSLTFQAIQVNGVALSGQPVYEQDLTANSTGCSANGATVTCTTNVSVPNGTVIFAVKAYDQVGAAGPSEGTSYAAASIRPGGHNRVVLGGAGSVVNSFSLYAGTSGFAAGSSASARLYVVALDGAAHVIVGAYNTPITLTATSTPTSGNVDLTINGMPQGSGIGSTSNSNDVITLVYDGAVAVTAISVSGTAGSASASVTVPVGTTSSLATFLGSNYSQNAGFAFDSSGESATLTVSGGTPPYTVSTSSSSVATASISGSTVTVWSAGYGSASINVTDSASMVTSFPVTVTAQPITLSATGCSSNVVTCASTGIMVTPGTQVTPTVTLGLSGGDGTYSYIWASTGTTSSSCDNANLSSNTITISANGSCSDLIVISSAGGTQTAYFPVIQETGTAGYTLEGTFHAYSPSAGTLTIVQSGQATLALTPGHGPWTETDTCGGHITTVFSGDSAILSADSSGTPTCTYTLTPSSGAALASIAITEIPPLQITSGHNSFTLHALGDAQSVTIANGTATGLSIATGSIEIVSGTSVTLQSYNPGPGTLIFAAGPGTGTNLISIRDKNLEEKVGIAVTVDNAYAAALPASIGVRYGGAGELSTLPFTINVPFTYSSVNAPNTTQSFGTGTVTLTPTQAGAATVTIFDTLGGTIAIPYTAFGISVNNPGSAVGATADEAFTAVGQTDFITVSGTNSPSLSSSNPGVVSVNENELTANAPGTATISVCDSSQTPSPCTTFTASVTTTTIPILGKGRRTH